MKSGSLPRSPQFPSIMLRPRRRQKILRPRGDQDQHPLPPNPKRHHQRNGEHNGKPRSKPPPPKQLRQRKRRDREPIEDRVETGKTHHGKITLAPTGRSQRSPNLYGIRHRNDCRADRHEKRENLRSPHKRPRSFPLENPDCRSHEQGRRRHSKNVANPKQHWVDGRLLLNQLRREVPHCPAPPGNGAISGSTNAYFASGDPKRARE